MHVLLLVENSLSMLDHWTDLQQHILPGVLGAVRIANPGIDVSISPFQRNPFKMLPPLSLSLILSLGFHEGVLTADVAMANLITQVQIFCMTTGKTQDARAPEPASPQKSQRQFNDFPDIDIVNLPRNRMSATFIRQSIDVS